MLPLLDLWSELQKTIWDLVASGFRLQLPMAIVFCRLHFPQDIGSMRGCASPQVTHSQSVCAISERTLGDRGTGQDLQCLSSIMIYCVSFSNFERFA